MKVVKKKADRRKDAKINAWAAPQMESYIIGFQDALHHSLIVSLLKDNTHPTEARSPAWDRRAATQGHIRTQILFISVKRTLHMCL